MGAPLDPRRRARPWLHFEARTLPAIPCAQHVWAQAPDRAGLDALWQAVR